MIYELLMLAFTACMVAMAWFSWENVKLANARLVESAKRFLDAVDKAGGESTLPPGMLADYRNAQNVLSDNGAGVKP